MWWRVLGVAAVLALVGAVVGYAVAADRADAPASIGSPEPVTAASPAFPTTPAVICPADPDDPALGIDLPAAPVTVRTGAKRGYPLTLDVPEGWKQHDADQNIWKWTAPSTSLYTYSLRATIVASQHQSVEVAKDSRITAYRSADRDGNLPHFELESDSGDTFVATFIDSGYCRLTMERVLTLGGTSAYVDVAVTGRYEDREGLMDLLARTSVSMSAN